ncbi:MAG: ankyrin repeat domain-containing protein [Clostridia bacterium]|jgi:hypothetical protein|nr:hypothetical protein [Clostridia bacterium]
MIDQNEIINWRNILANKRGEIGNEKSDELGYELLELLNDNWGNILEEDLYIKANKLLLNGANLNIKEKNTLQTFVMKVAEKGFITLVDLCCKSGADLDLQDINGESALMKVANQRVLDIARKEFKSTGKVTKAKSVLYKFIPMLNYYIHYDKIMRLLIENHCDLDLQNNKGLTALSYATKYGVEKSFIRMLVKSGASPLIETREKYPRLASDLANGNENCVEYLHKAEQEWIANNFIRPVNYSPEIYFAEMDKQAEENIRN